MNDNKTKVFELVEITPEQYFSQGLFTTQEDAINAIRSDRPHCEDGSDVVNWEVRQRTIGVIGHGNDIVVAKVTLDKILGSFRQVFLGE